jgi:hypothetical protein
VVVYPQKRTDYMSGPYAGLFELRAAGDAVLTFSARSGPGVYESDPSNLCADVDAGRGRKFKVCFDTADWRTIASFDDLRDADVYFKRSYHAPYLDQLESSLRRKVLPLGLLYGCSSRQESISESVRDALAYQRATGALRTNPLKALKHIVANPIKRVVDRSRRTTTPRLPLYIDEFEVSPDRPAEPKIFYRTRVYGPSDAPDSFRAGRINEVNEMRVGTIRSLRAHFGERFTGGLRSSAYAQAMYPDCLDPFDRGLRGHVAESNTCLINVNTAGLHDSTSWKIPEYMAGSRCIVSEPMLYRIPVSLIEGTHYLAFSSADECIAACERLLSNPELARAMRAANFAYYRAHVRPDRLIANCVQAALQHCADAI